MEQLNIQEENTFCIRKIYESFETEKDTFKQYELVIKYLYLSWYERKDSFKKLIKGISEGNPRTIYFKDGFHITFSTSRIPTHIRYNLAENKTGEIIQRYNDQILKDLNIPFYFLYLKFSKNLDKTCNYGYFRRLIKEILQKVAEGNNMLPDEVDFNVDIID